MLASHLAPEKDRKLVILDCDPGIDDAMALLYLGAARGINLHSVTTIFGNASVETTSRNAAYLAARFGLDLPIHMGAAHPLEGDRHLPALKVHGEDGLGNTGMADGFPMPPTSTPAWAHIAETVAAHPGEVSILAIGPLTNLALALRHRPEIAGHVREVVVMGGAFGTRGRHGNIRPNAEANFFYDPLAADEVLAASWPVTAVGLDVSSDCILTSKQVEAIAASSGEIGQLLWAISRDYAEIYRRFDGIDGFCIHDVAAAARIIAPELFSVRRAALGVRTEGEDSGHSFVGTRDLRREQLYCEGVAADQLIADFMVSIMRFTNGMPHNQRKDAR